MWLSMRFEQLVRLTSDVIDSLVPQVQDRMKLKQAMLEVKENELFYVAVDAILSHLGMEKVCFRSLLVSYIG